MSALRLSVPGKDIELVQPGPARARLSTNQYGSHGGPLEEQELDAEELHPGAPWNIAGVDR